MYPCLYYLKYTTSSLTCNILFIKSSILYSLSIPNHNQSTNQTKNTHQFLRKMRTKSSKTLKAPEKPKRRTWSLRIEMTKLSL
ncbi:hypothetical protein Hanom_Chr04g00309191 [Helianthus anomalus]